MFGLSVERVQRAIEGLPGANRCDRYCGWPEGAQPDVPPLVSSRPQAAAGLPAGSGTVGIAGQECLAVCGPSLHTPHAAPLTPCSFCLRRAVQSAAEQRERLACEARMQRLPDGVRGVAVEHT